MTHKTPTYMWYSPQFEMTRKIAGTIQLATISLNHSPAQCNLPRGDVLDLRSSSPCETIKTDREGETDKSGVVESSLGWRTTRARFSRYFGI